VPRSCAWLTIAASLVVAAAPSALAQDGSAQVCPGGPADEKSVQISTPLTQPIATLASRIDLSLDSLGYTVARRDTVVGLWVTAPSHHWPLGSESEDWHGDVNPGVQVAVFETSDSSGPSLAVAAIVICNLKDQATAAAPVSVESVLEMLSAVQVMNAISLGFDHKPQ